jgi:hypothetical protein
MSCSGVSSTPTSLIFSESRETADSAQSSRITKLISEGKIKVAAALLKNVAQTKPLSTATMIIDEIPQNLQGTKAQCQQAVVKGLLDANKDAEAERIATAIEDNDDRSDALVLIVEKFVKSPSKLDEAIRISREIKNQLCRDYARQMLADTLKACGRTEDAAKISQEPAA